MSQRLVVTGTDTDVGKTVFAAALAAALNAYYWKPIQAGLTAPTDSQTVNELGGVPADRILPEAWRLTTPCSPHRSAELDGVAIDASTLEPPPVSPLVIEGAGGLLVPVNRSITFADLFARWGLPVVLVARTALGTINHSLLAIEALRARSVPLLGVAFVGEANEDSEATVASFGGVKRLGRLPQLERLERDRLAAAFADNFRVADFAA